MSRFPTSRRNDSPRRVRNGLKLRWVAVPPSPQGWVGRGWLQLMSQSFSPDVLEEGLAYARSGQVVSLEVLPGRAQADVQGRASRPYATAITWPTLAPRQWEGVIGAMAGEAMYAAKLLAGELPPAVAALCASLEADLIPTDGKGMLWECRCARGKPCRHLAAAAYLLLERLEDDPLLIFTLRGLPAPLLIERLRETRRMVSGDESSSSPDAGRVLGLLHRADGPNPGAGAGAGALEQCLDEYWRPGPELEVLEQSAPPQHVSHALLRRLGPSPLGGRFPLVGLLASVYDAVSAAAIHLRDEGESIDASQDIPPSPRGRGQG
jgi:uncharacterized Zn finger protein